jgi:type VI secretion system protein ImpC
MPRIVSSKYGHVHLSDDEKPDAADVTNGRPFRILLAGDFSGRSWREDSPCSFTPILIDRDNFDEVFEDLRVSLNLHRQKLSFREIEDFHPDRIWAAVPAFQDLDHLLDQADTPAPGGTTAPRGSAASAGLLDQIVDEQGEVPRTRVSAEDAGDLPSFIRRILAGHVTPREDPTVQERASRRRALDTEVMRGVLHDPRFQAIEAAWRALGMLIRGLDTDGNLKLYILDLTLPELVEHRDAIREELEKKDSWGLIAGNYSFGQTELDAQVLRRIGAMASALHAPFLAEAEPPGEKAIDQAWIELRHSPEARWIGLALPRFLLRLPYGRSTIPIETFPFEEMPESNHAAYLWGNPAFFCAYLLGHSFLSSGWEPSRIHRRVDGLPMHMYQEDGQQVAKPCAEVLMSERNAWKLLDAGFMPLASLKEQDAALIVRFQSIAQPPTPLPGFEGKTLAEAEPRLIAEMARPRAQREPAEEFEAEPVPDSDSEMPPE